MCARHSKRTVCGAPPWAQAFLGVALLASLSPGAAQGAGPTTRPDAAALLPLLAEGTPKSLRQAMDGFVKSGDPRVTAFLKDYYLKSATYLYDGKVVLKGAKHGDRIALLDPLSREPLKDATGAPLVVPEKDVKDLDVGRREMGLASAAIQTLELAAMLAHPDPETRIWAMVRAADRGDPAAVPALTAALSTEHVAKAKWTLEESLARIEFEQGAKALIERHQDAQQEIRRLRYSLAKDRREAQGDLTTAKQSGDPKSVAGAEAKMATIDVRAKELDPTIATIEATLKAAADEAQHPEEIEKRKVRHAAAAKLGQLQSLRAVSRIRDAKAAEVDPAVAAAYDPPLANIQSWQRTVDWSGYLFSGLSAGSILILVALGLSIIFGVMGVINMAQGELVMIGAYSAYMVQVVFLWTISRGWLSEAAFDWYFVAAIPFSFLLAAGVGMLMEATVVRRLYGRPLDTLLATFGIGLVLTQAVRAIFGDNIGVRAPSWLQKGWEVVPDIVLPYNRVFAIGFCAACIVLMYLIMSRTKLGLLLRATTQNRPMASALGVPTKRVDLYTFGLGAGLAGLAGCALAPIEGVTPNMGQNYIIDSFLVVVTGGVGKLAGTIWSGAGLGVINKVLEPIFQTVWAKVIILGIVVAFLQWRPSGLFPAKGRLADA